LGHSAIETDKSNLGGVGASMPIVTVVQNLARNSQTEPGPAATVGYNMVLPNSSKSPSKIPMLNSAPVAPVTDFIETLNWCKDELSRSIESSLGVQINPSSYLSQAVPFTF
jgi:hypothetical protein